MDEIKITTEQAYLAMIAFLENYYSLTNADEIGALLGGLSLLPDGGSADPAAKSDWDDAIQKVLLGKVNAQLQLNT
ncbi:hypothetical protein EMM73_03235 [Rheinheimera sediminis]|uniref:hypothetical protein n=1 Tax=Rheinheimera sp. YQF-1 TaxID=2499626 RepID=UPI000FDC9AAA|nr:hypothetical protein [Rheinheimera sp. YQF-1]RVT47779.1 hypothetical protein EMM73_03235 [Rheinheimera sp. YQF-1]